MYIKNFNIQNINKYWYINKNNILITRFYKNFKKLYYSMYLNSLCLVNKQNEICKDRKLPVKNKKFIKQKKFKKIRSNPVFSNYII